MDPNAPVPVAPRRRWRDFAPVVLGVGLVGGLLGHLLRPGMVMAGRDIPFLHLPLRLDFARLLADGLPTWNPWLHGGQPVLSNPHYAAWYPATWLVAAMPAHQALAVAVVLHALFAFAGAYRFARHLGCERGAGALAATAFAAGGWFLALTNTTLLFFGMAWFPWILLWGDRLLRADSRSAAVRAAVPAAGAWGLQILNGDPTAVMVTGIALALLAAETGAPAVRGAGRLEPWRRLATLALLALLVGAVQAVPTWFRLRDSVRGEGLGLAQAAVWSTRPERLVELVAPHFFGDVARDEEDLYFGWALHDRGTPFLLSVAPGLLAVVLALAALGTRGVPRRTLWVGALAGGLFLGLGRHNPLFPFLHALLPFLASLRYPEKFLLLPLACVPFAAGLGWQQLLERRRARRRWRLPLALAAIVALLGVALALACWWPGAAEALVRAQSGLPPPPAALGKGAAYWRREALVAAVNALLVLGFLVGARRARSERGLAVGAVLLLAADLAYYGRRFSPTLPESLLFAAPEVVRGAAPGERVFTDLPLRAGPEVGPRIGAPGTFAVRGRLEWLDPYSGNFWRLGHVLHEDYDLMLTAWARVPLAALHETWPDRELGARLLGAWNAALLVHVRTAEEMLPELRAGRRPALSTARANPELLPRFRSVPEVWFHPDPRAALAAARASGYRVAALEHLVGASPDGARHARFGLAQILAAKEGGRGIELRVRAPAPALLVCAITFDRGWTAAVDGAAVPLWPTALGQVAALVPAGEHQVSLRYRDPWVAVGGALSMVSVLAMGLVLRRASSRRER